MGNKKLSDHNIYLISPYFKLFYWNYRNSLYKICDFIYSSNNNNSVLYVIFIIF